jgi:hypothetical protein
LLYVQVEPRHSIYVSSETTGSFIVDAALSFFFGDSYYNSTSVAESSNEPFMDLHFTIAVESKDKALVTNQVAINTTDNLFDFDLTQLKPRMNAYNIVLYGASQDGNQTYTSTTKLYYLPAKTTGSMTKIDNLNGGFLFANNVSKYAFEPYLMFGFYTDYGGYIEQNFSNIKAYYDQGYSAIHPIPTFSDNLTSILDYFDELNLPFQYDMRGTYTNLTSVQEQVEMVMDYTSLIAYYTADEPDGWQYALNSTKLAYDLIASLDKYHPVGLVLNCKNFYFKDYSAGADYLMEDAYPVAINATWSIPWGTPCNSTYGDCGCDDCVGELRDVSDRLDAFSNYQEWLGQWPKPYFAVPQAFSGEGYWSRNPSAEETWVMILVSFNHKAKSIMSWTFPTTTDLATAYSQLSKVVTVTPVLGFLTGAQPQAISVKRHPLLDVAYWTVGDQVMVSVANMDYASTTSTITIDLPVTPAYVSATPWGSVSWTLSGKTLAVKGLTALSTSLIILEM